MVFPPKSRPISFGSISATSLFQLGDEASMSHIFVKYQIIFNLLNLKLSTSNKLYFEINEDLFKKLDLHVVSLNKIGSVYELVIKVDKNINSYQIIKDNLDPILLEEIPLTYNEIITLQMLDAKMEESKHE